MPTYDYKCSACDHIFEKSSKIADRKNPESEPCPECGKLEVKLAILTNCALKDRVGVHDLSMRKKMPQDFKETMRHIKRGHKGSTIPDY